MARALRSLSNETNPIDPHNSVQTIFVKVDKTVWSFNHFGVKKLKISPFRLLLKLISFFLNGLKWFKLKKDCPL